MPKKRQKHPQSSIENGA